MFVMYLLLDAVFFLPWVWLLNWLLFQLALKMTQCFDWKWADENVFFGLGVVFGYVMSALFLFSDFLHLTRWLGWREAKGWHIWWLPC